MARSTRASGIALIRYIAGKKYGPAIAVIDLSCKGFQLRRSARAKDYIGPFGRENKAAAAPIPLLAPVTMIDLFFSSMMALLTYCVRRSSGDTDGAATQFLLGRRAEVSKCAVYEVPMKLAARPFTSSRPGEKRKAGLTVIAGGKSGARPYSAASRAGLLAWKSAMAAMIRSWSASVR